jgi:hypothetical protein
VTDTTNGEVPVGPVDRLVSLRWSGTPRRWPVQGEIAAKRSTLHCYSIARLGGSELDTLRPRACVTRILYDARNDFSGNRSAVRTTTSRGKAWHSRRRDQFHSLRVSTNDHVMRRTRREPPPARTQAQVVVSPMITIISSLRPVDTGLVMRGLLVSHNVGQ